MDFYLYGASVALGMLVFGVWSIAGLVWWADLPEYPEHTFLQNVVIIVAGGPLLWVGGAGWAVGLILSWPF